MQKQIGLCMIVKDEAHVITRCLDSVKPIVDFVLILDTGSTDGTPDVIFNYLKDHNILGVILNEPWKDFAYNRTQAVLKLKEVWAGCDYGLMVDADEVLVYDEGFDIAVWKSSLDCDLYDVTTSYGGISYVRPQLFRNTGKFKFKGVLHEYLEADDNCTRGVVKGFVNKPIQDSARSKNPNKFADDANVLAKALLTETDPFLVSRYTFYLAQSYRDSGQNNLALNVYISRSKQGYWAQEVYMSLLYAARLKAVMQYPVSLVIEAFMEAYEVLPHRVEALYEVAKHCRLHSRYHQGYLYASTAKALNPTSSDLFMEQWIYDYGLLDELSILAYYVGSYTESRVLTERLIEENKFPPEYLPRLRENLTFSLNALKN